MSTWVTDENGNRASVEYWGDKRAAKASLATLKNCQSCVNCMHCTGCACCTDCTDCTYCTYCKDCMHCTDCTGCACCTDCTDCTYCTYCKDCMHCTDCKDCDLSMPNHRLPVSDPRGYTWLAILEDGAWRIHAGCRSYEIEQARAHWLAPGYDGPATVKETVGFALNWIEGKEPNDS